MAAKKGVFWTGNAGDNNWLNKSNWMIGDSLTDPTGYTPTYAPGIGNYVYTYGYYPSIYITKSADIKFSSMSSSTLDYIGDLYIQGTSTSPISVTISDPVSPSSGSTMNMSIRGDFVIKNYSYFKFIINSTTSPTGSIYIYGKSTGSVIDIGDALSNQKFQLFFQIGTTISVNPIADYSVTLASDLIMRYDSGIRYSYGTINLNGYGITCGAWYVSGSARLQEIIFTPRSDNWTTGKNNLSYLRINGLDIRNAYPATSTSWYPNLFYLTDYNSLSFKGIGQRAIIVYGIDEGLKTYGDYPIYPLSYTKLITVELGAQVSYSIYGDHSKLLTYNQPEFSPDLYFIDEHPNNVGVYFKFGLAYGTVDFTGSTPGDNVPSGPGFKSKVGFTNEVSFSSRWQFFTGHFLLNSDQKIAHLERAVDTGDNFNYYNVSNSTAAYVYATFANSGFPIRLHFIHQPKIRRNTIQGWLDDPTPLAKGEIGWEFDPNNPTTADKIKIGDGIKSWKQISNYSVKNQAAGWSTSFVLKSGQIGWETNTNKLKIGNGVTTWGLLDYSPDQALPTYVDYTGHPSYYCGLGDGWILDFKQNSLKPTKQAYSGIEYTRLEYADLPLGTMFFLKPNAKVYLLSDLSTNNVHILCPDTTGCIFLVGTARIVFSHTMYQDGGTVSTVYSDGDLTSPKIINTHNPGLPSNPTWVNANPTPPPYDYKKASDIFTSTFPTTALYYYLRGYWLSAGLLELYSQRDIELIGRFADGSNPSHSEYSSSLFVIYRYDYAGNSSQTDKTANINFYFFSSRSYSEGIIGTDLFLQKTPVNIGMYSDIGNLVTTSSDESFANFTTDFVAIKTLFGGNNAATSTSASLARTWSSELGSYRSAVVWYETTDIYVISTTTNKLKSYQNIAVDRPYQYDPLPRIWLNDINTMLPAGPLIAKISREDSGNPYAENLKLIHAASGNTYFIIDFDNTVDNTDIAFYIDPNASSSDAHYKYSVAKVAGLDLTIAPVTGSTIRAWNRTSALVVTEPFNTPLFYVTNKQGGHIFDLYNTRYFDNLNTIMLSGGSSNTPAFIDIKKLTNRGGNNSIALTIHDNGYYCIKGDTFSLGDLTLVSGTLNQTLNDSKNSPTFRNINLDGGYSNRTFIHGFNTYVGNPVAFKLSGWEWKSTGYNLTITTLNTQTQEQYAPSVIEFISKNPLGNIVLRPGRIDNLNITNSVDQNALTFSFNTVTDYTYIITIEGRDQNPSEDVCVQTLLLGSYDYGTYTRTWQGFSGYVQVNSNLIFCGNANYDSGSTNYSPFYDTMDQYQTSDGIGYGHGIWNKTQQFGGLIAGPSYIYGLGKLYFQGSGLIQVRGDSPTVTVGTSTYKNLIQYNFKNPNIGDTYINAYSGSWKVNENVDTSNYTLFGSFSELNLLGGYNLLDSEPIAIYDYFNTVTVETLLVKDTIQGKNATRVEVFGIDLKIGTKITTYKNDRTVFSPRYTSGLKFANNVIFNANLGDYFPDATNYFTIGSYKKSTDESLLVPLVTINPCLSDIDGAPLVDQPSSAIFGDLTASGEGPTQFEFAAGSTSTFVYFTYNDTAAPLDNVNNWQAYAFTSSNTILKSTINNQPWYISIITPHSGTIKDKRVVSNLTIKDSYATESYIWFAPGTPNVTKTGTSYREGYISNGIPIKGALVNYYNYDNGGNTGWVFHEPPSATMDLSFWANPPYEILAESSSSYYLNTFYGQSWSSTTYITPGSFVWICPANVYSVSVTVIGAGGGGGQNNATTAGSGGGGGGLAWVGNLLVTPGQSYNVVVGSGGSSGANGTDSSFAKSQVFTITGRGGKSGSAGPSSQSLLGGAGGTATVFVAVLDSTLQYGTNSGGQGGSYDPAYSGANGLNSGGGGAAGYRGAGGIGQGNSNAIFTSVNAGTGGASAGGYISGGVAYGGGGTSAYGEGNSGSVGSQGGSGGESSINRVGGKFGGGVSSGDGGGSGGTGAVRISWPGYFGPK